MSSTNLKRKLEHKIRLLVQAASTRILGPELRPLRPMASPQEPVGEHPEAMALRPYCVGRGIDVGCGHRKVAPSCIGVDVLPRGATGAHGVVAGQVSVADIEASGDALTMFGDGTLDYVVSRHNLEHYVDPVKTLLEWKRVLRPGGALAIVVPDERWGDTVFLDPTHKHCFTPESLSRLLHLVGGFGPVHTETVVPNWSFLAAATRGEGG